MDADLVLCEDPGHRVLQAIAGSVIGLSAIMPAVALVMLLRARRQYRDNGDPRREATAIRVAHSMGKGFTLQDAADVMQEVSTSSSAELNHLLTSEYRPNYCYWVCRITICSLFFPMCRHFIELIVNSCVFRRWWTCAMKAISHPAWPPTTQ